MAGLWKPSVKVNSTDSGPDGNDQSQPSIAQLGDGYVVVWFDPTPGNRDYIRAQKFGFLGQKIGGEFIVSDLANITSEDPDVTALSNGGFAVTYETGLASIDLSMFDSLGNRVADVAIQTGQNGGADPFVVARPDGGVYVTWEADVNGARVVRGVTVSSNGDMGTIRTVFSGVDTVHNLDAASFGNGDVVSLFARDEFDGGTAGVSGDRYLGFRYINEDGSLSLSRRIASSTELFQIDLNSAHVARVPGFGLAFAWSQSAGGTDDTVRVKVYDTAGNLIVSDEIIQSGEDWTVEDIIGYEQSNGSGSGFTVIFRNDATNELRGQDYDEDGARSGTVYHIADNVQDAQMSMMADGRIAVAIARATDSNSDIRTFILDPRSFFVTGTEGSDSLTGRTDSTFLSGLGGDDLLYGGKSIDILNGGDGDDILLGNGGNDVLNGGRGEDAISGGNGTDTVSYSDLDMDDGIPIAGFETIFQVSLLEGKAILRHSSVLDPKISLTITDTLSSIENVQGSDFDEDIEGNDGNNRITGLIGDKRYYGRGGNDTITTGSGRDVLNGGAGDDTLEGGDGNDIYIIDSVGDRVIEEGTGNDTIYAFNFILCHMNNTPNVEKLYYNYIEGSFSHIIGNALDNVISQGIYSRDGNGIQPGNDTLDGGAGNDFMSAGEGDDKYIVDSSLDFVSEGTKLVGGVDTVESTAATFSLITSASGRVENLFFTGSGAFTGQGNDYANEIRGGALGDALSGRGGNDTIFGFGGADTLNGDNGNDKLDGGSGNDTLIGAAGNDAFVFSSLNDGIDTITDFVSNSTGNNDRLTFELADIGQPLGNSAGGTGTGNLKAMHFQSSSEGEATSANARFIYDIDNGQLRFDADGNGSGASILLAILTGAPTLTNADIVIV